MTVVWGFVYSPEDVFPYTTVSGKLEETTSNELVFPNEGIDSEWQNVLSTFRESLQIGAFVAFDRVENHEFDDGTPIRITLRYDEYDGFVDLRTLINTDSDGGSASCNCTCVCETCTLTVVNQMADGDATCNTACVTICESSLSTCGLFQGIAEGTCS